MRLDRDFSEFIGFLSAHEVRFLVVEVQLDEVVVPFIGLDDLRRNKTASGRPQDLADLDALDG